MNQKLFITLILASFLFAACAPGAATPTAEAILLAYATVFFGLAIWRFRFE